MNNTTRRTPKLNLLDNIDTLKHSVELNKAVIETQYIQRYNLQSGSQGNKQRNDGAKNDPITCDLRLMRKRISIKDFNILRPIGAGAFGVIRLAQCKYTSKVYALKQMRKSIIRTKNQLERIYSERALLVQNASDYVVRLFYTFQDDKHLYQVMEYLPGGDLMSYLIKLDKFSEEDTKFYMAELVHAVDLVHQLGFVHRDVKPDNIVLDSNGHLKLLDFGLCKFAPTIEEVNSNSKSYSHFHNLRRNSAPDSLKLEDIKKERRREETVAGSSCSKENKNSENVGENNYSNATNKSNGKLEHPGRKTLHSTVGTPQYMAPEIFLRQGYSNLVDWWSVGILMYECLYGGVPFNDDTHNPIKVAIKVMQWEKLLLLPHPCRQISPEALDLLRNLLCHQSKRFNGEQIKKHPFFKGIDWNQLRQLPAPFKKIISIENQNVPKSEGTTNKRQDIVIEESPTTSKFGVQGSSLVDLNFLDYTYRNTDRRYTSISLSETIKLVRG
ncbi:protein kinase domain-containing protein [Cryptosporidium muris RN66]|uniref:non-specific serine/threonine protein kinase n=1 Tax=Cryptosporidium muris (strain RN66) TaxID=441375 RepID=B6AH05_CRYMR|nr:protein kinase domain-containing protein [Cryptosporidium muris RN66]EEA07496.1 protein kinase domain-containing protein [Cryptosporidium muris RN66]|eukprot:XP_002141845.1 protein kinase domain-containing protein [Cryptosporidium muris RN66]